MINLEKEKIIRIFCKLYLLLITHHTATANITISEKDTSEEVIEPLSQRQKCQPYFGSCSDGYSCIRFNSEKYYTCVKNKIAYCDSNEYCKHYLSETYKLCYTPPWENNNGKKQCFTVHDIGSHCLSDIHCANDLFCFNNQCVSSLYEADLFKTDKIKKNEMYLGLNKWIFFIVISPLIFAIIFICYCCYIGKKNENIKKKIRTVKELEENKRNNIKYNKKLSSTQNSQSQSHQKMENNKRKRPLNNNNQRSFKKKDSINKVIVKSKEKENFENDTEFLNNRNSINKEEKNKGKKSLDSNTESIIKRDSINKAKINNYSNYKNSVDISLPETYINISNMDYSVSPSSRSIENEPIMNRDSFNKAVGKNKGKNSLDNNTKFIIKRDSINKAKINNYSNHENSVDISLLEAYINTSNMDDNISPSAPSIENILNNTLDNFQQSFSSSISNNNGMDVNNILSHIDNLRNFIVNNYTNQNTHNDDELPQYSDVIRETMAANNANLSSLLNDNWVNNNTNTRNDLAYTTTKVNETIDITNIKK